MGSKVERRIRMTVQSGGAMKKVYESRGISRKAKVSVYNSGNSILNLWV